MHLLHRLAVEQEKAILLSTHDIEQALVLSDKLWLLSKEHGLQTGVTEDIILNHQMENLFPHKDIHFDYNHGVYYPTITGQRKISVESEDKTLLHWVINALNRNGFQCLSTPQIGIPHLIALSATELVLEKTVFNSFEKLLNNI